MTPPLKSEKIRDRGNSPRPRVQFDQQVRTIPSSPVRDRSQSPKLTPQAPPRVEEEKKPVTLTPFPKVAPLASTTPVKEKTSPDPERKVHLKDNQWSGWKWKNKKKKR